MPFRHRDPNVELGINTLIELGVLKEDGLREFGKAIRAFRAIAAGMKPEPLPGEAEFFLEASAGELSEEPAPRRQRRPAMPLRGPRLVESKEAEQESTQEAGKDVPEPEPEVTPAPPAESPPAETVDEVIEQSVDADKDDPEFFEGVPRPHDDDPENPGERRHTDGEETESSSPSTPRNSRRGSLDIGEGQLRLLYKNFTAEQIATMYGCSASTVNARLKQWKIGKEWS